MAQLRRAILDGAYAYRERLPAERELAQYFGASRSTVRDALKTLVQMRLVDRRVGSGTYVIHSAEYGEADIADATSPLQLIDVRLAVEPQMARLAVLNGANRELDRMAEILEQLEDCGSDREQFSRLDEQFHLSLAECTRNPLMMWLYRQINNVRGHQQWNAMKDTILTPSRIVEYNQQHRTLYDALRSRDVDDAVRVITEHLKTARSDLLGAEEGRWRRAG